MIFLVNVRMSERLTLSLISLHCLELIKEVLLLDEKIHDLALELYTQRSLLVMGRGYNYATCLEGALVSSSLASLLL